MKTFSKLFAAFFLLFATASLLLTAGQLWHVSAQTAPGAPVQSNYGFFFDVPSSGVYIGGNGNVYPDLCSALAFIQSSVAWNSGQTRSRVYDFNKYEVWSVGRDPWNSASCGGGTSFAPSVYLGNGTFVNATGTSISLPPGTELYLQGRAAENSLNSTNGCQAANPTICVGTLIIAYQTASPFTGSNAMACPSGRTCTVLANSTPVIDFGSSGTSFGTLIKGPGTISCAGISGSIGVQNTSAQEQSYIDTLAVVGCQAIGIDWNGGNAQNSYVTGFEILSGNLTGATIGTPPAFIGLRVQINGPNRDYGEGTCNMRGAATLAPTTACVQVISSRGGRIHDIHYETSQFGVLEDGSSNVIVENINTASVLNPSNISSISSNGSNTTTVVTTTANNAIAGESVTFAGTGVGFDGTTCTAIAITNSTTFTCTQVLGALSANVGTATLSGVALVKLCAAGSAAPCSSGVAVTNAQVFGLQRTSPNVTLDAVLDDNRGTAGTIALASWNGSYFENPPHNTVAASLDSWCNGTIGATGGTAYVLVPSNTAGTTCSTASSTSAQLMGRACTVQNLYVVGSANGTATFTLYKNNSATTLTCGTSAASSCTDTNLAHGATFAATDRWSMEAIPTGASDTSANIRATFECVN